MNNRQEGFISFAAMTLLVGGLAFAGLLLYGLKSGQELPLWPAIAVALVNLVATAKIILDVRKAKALQQEKNQETLSSTGQAKPARRRKTGPQA